jgi:PAS domain S-box-containing protein
MRPEPVSTRDRVTPGSEGDEPYRPLFEHNPQPMWVYDRETLRFLAVNEAAVAHYGYTRDEFLAMRITDIRPEDDIPAVLESVAQRSGLMQDRGQWRHRVRDGRIIRVEVHSHAVTFGGRAAHLVLASDATSRLEAVEALQRANDDYERQYAALVDLTRSGLTRGSTPSALLEMTETTARTLNVSRVSLWRFTPERDAIVASDLFELHTLQHSSGHELRASAYPAYFRALATNDVIAADRAEHDDRTREFAQDYLRPHGITSMLDTPLLVSGALEGVLCLEHVGPPRTWTAGERSFAMSVANLVALLIAQQTRAESESRLRTILASEPECVMVVGLDGTVHSINPAGLRIVEADGERDVIGLPLDAFVAAGDRPAVAAHHERVSTGASATLEFRMTGLRGSTRWVETHSAPLRDGAGRVTAVLSIVRDITEQRRSQEALRTSEERFQLLARATNDAVWDLDIATDELWWGDGFETLFGFRPDEDTTLEAWSLRVHPDDRERVVTGLSAAIANAETGNWSDEYRFRRRDGSWAHVVDRGHLIRDADGRGVRMIGGMQDVTDRKNLESQLLHSQKLESIGRLAGGIAHDFNNLLTVVLGTVELIVGAHRPQPELAEDLREIQRAAERAAGLTQQLLAFSRRQLLQPRVVNLNVVVSDTVSMLHRLIGEDIDLDFQPADNLWNVRADAGQFEQVLVNLAVNARDAMPAGGTLTIETANIETSGADAGAAPSGRRVMLRVTDTGVGMDDVAKAHAFEPFFTTKSLGLGTGLGLATVYGIVQQSGGSIHLDSEAGRGAVFTILLPASGDSADARAVDGSMPDADGSETILLVEDEPALRRLAERVLRTAGYSVVAASGGEEALRLLQERRDPVQLLLTDVVMPRMSGPELARVVSDLAPQTRVLFMSGYAQDALLQAELDGGRLTYLEKPFTTAQLIASVRRVLDAR